MTRKRLPQGTRNGRRLRRQMTEVERLLWWRIRRGALTCRYRRQVPIGPYVADFACLRDRLVIECDGGQHCESDHDMRRDRYMESKGFTVVRLWNSEILRDLEGTVERIAGLCAGKC